jgi:hypothetical protein
MVGAGGRIMVCILPGQGGRGKCSVAISFIEEGVAATCGSQPLGGSGGRGDWRSGVPGTGFGAQVRSRGRLFGWREGVRETELALWAVGHSHWRSVDTEVQRTRPVHCMSRSL